MIIWSTSEGWKTELRLDPTSSFEPRTHGLTLCYKNNLNKTLDYWSRDLLNFDFLEKGIVNSFSNIFCTIFLEDCFSCYVLLTVQISFFDCLYFLRYWTICLLSLLVSQVLMSYVSSFYTWTRSQGKNLNILRTKRPF